MQKAIVLDLCDECWKGNRDEVEATYRFTFFVHHPGGGSELAFDLCDEHVHAMSVHEMFSHAHEPDQQTSKQKRIRRKNPKVECVICGNWYAGGSGIKAHVTAAHRDEINKHKVIVKD